MHLQYVNWDFQIYLLQRCGLGEKWRQQIYFCIPVVYFYMIINGAPNGFIESGRDQGDPHLFLFLIVMEVCSKITNGLNVIVIFFLFFNEPGLFFFLISEPGHF